MKLRLLLFLSLTGLMPLHATQLPIAETSTKNKIVKMSPEEKKLGISFLQHVEKNDLQTAKNLLAAYNPEIQHKIINFCITGDCAKYKHPLSFALAHNTYEIFEWLINHPAFDFEIQLQNFQYKYYEDQYNYTIFRNNITQALIDTLIAKNFNIALVNATKIFLTKYKTETAQDWYDGLKKCIDTHDWNTLDQLLSIHCPEPINDGFFEYSESLLDYAIQQKKSACISTLLKHGIKTINPKSYKHIFTTKDAFADTVSYIPISYTSGHGEDASPFGSDDESQAIDHHSYEYKLTHGLRTQQCSCTLCSCKRIYRHLHF